MVDQAVLFHKNRFLYDVHFQLRSMCALFTITLPWLPLLSSKALFIDRVKICTRVEEVFTNPRRFLLQTWRRSVGSVPPRRDLRHRYVFGLVYNPWGLQCEHSV